jgi:hypothetical protein
MAKGTLTLHHVPADLRARRADKARQQIREYLENPTLTDKQRAHLNEQLKWVARWERGEVEDILPKPPEALPAAPEVLSLPPAPAPSVPPKAPVNHSISLTESVSVEEG